MQELYTLAKCGLSNTFVTITILGSQQRFPFPEHLQVSFDTLPGLLSLFTPSLKPLTQNLELDYSPYAPAVTALCMVEGFSFESGKVRWGLVGGELRPW